MKKSELSFKCVVPNNKEENNLISALCNAGLLDRCFGAGWCFLMYNAQGLSANRDEKQFCSWSEPLMSYDEALKLIESVEPDAPEFDIKPFDKVIVRVNESATWNCDFFNQIGKKVLYVMGWHNGDILQAVKKKGNESLIGTKDTPAGWWECENGKPVWRTR